MVDSIESNHTIFYTLEHLSDTQRHQGRERAGSEKRKVRGKRLVSGNQLFSENNEIAAQSTRHSWLLQPTEGDKTPTNPRRLLLEESCAHDSSTQNFSKRG